MRKIGGNRVSRLFEIGKTTRIRTHELKNPLDSGWLPARCDIDQDQRATTFWIVAGHRDANEATHRRADHDRRRRRLRADKSEVSSQLIDRIVTIFQPVTFSVAAGIESGASPSGRCSCRSAGGPSVAGLTKAVGENDRLVAFAEYLRCQFGSIRRSQAMTRRTNGWGGIDHTHKYGV